MPSYFILFFNIIIIISRLTKSKSKRERGEGESIHFQYSSFLARAMDTPTFMELQGTDYLILLEFMSIFHKNNLREFHLWKSHTTVVYDFQSLSSINQKAKNPTMLPYETPMGDQSPKSLLGL